MNRALIARLLVLLLVLMPGCSRKEDRRIVLYSSVDAGVLKPILDAYTQRTGVRVDVVSDTEATKTTGLVNRLITERDNPRADVWWSGETVGTVQLSRAGVLARYASPAADAAARASGSLHGWPLVSARSDWYGLALRPRVIVWRTADYANADAAPRSLRGLVESKKTVAMANPAFGTARGHLAALYVALGRDEFVKTLSSIAWRVYDGNAAVVRAVANGECPLGITDYDDFRGAIANGWGLSCSLLPLTNDAEAGSRVFTTPGTIALVAGAPHAELAKGFIDDVLSPAVEQTLAAGDWSSWPVLKGVPVPEDRFKGLTAAAVDWEKGADFLSEAAAAWEEARKK